MWYQKENVPRTPIYMAAKASSLSVEGEIATQKCNYFLNYTAQSLFFKI